MDSLDKQLELLVEAEHRDWSADLQVLQRLADFLALDSMLVTG